MNSAVEPASERLRKAGRVFRGSLTYTGFLTLYWLYCVLAPPGAGYFFHSYKLDVEAIRRAISNLDGARDYAPAVGIRER